MFVIKHHGIGEFFNGFRHTYIGDRPQTIPLWASPENSMQIVVYENHDTVTEALEDLHRMYSGEEFAQIIAHRINFGS